VELLKESGKVHKDKNSFEEWRLTLSRRARALSKQVQQHHQIARSHFGRTRIQFEKSK